MTKILLYSSQLAAFIGKNAHTNTSRIFNKLYERYFEDVLTKIKMVDQLREANIGDSGSIDKLSQKMENNKDLRVKLDNLCKANLSSSVMKKETENLVKKVLETEKLTEDEQNILKKVADGYTNKKFGTIREVNALDIYKKNMKIDIVTGIQSRTKKILEYEGYELLLISKIDAMKYDGTVLEVKNRMYRIFEEVREYEWLQVQAYLEVYNLENAELVEYLRTGEGEMRVSQIGRDRKFWEEIVKRELMNYFKTFIKLVVDPLKLKKYLKMTENEQNELIKKMVRKEAKEK